MNAIEFVKKYGIESAVKVLKSAPVSATSYRVSENNRLGLGGLYGRVENINGCILSLCDLKQIVDAYELVEEKGGLISAKKYLKFLQSSVDIGLYHGLDDVNYETEIPLMKQAINLVEQCQ